ncbi:MAG: phosphatase PAP2 family protein, partial [Hyphomicrobiales bacterium]|nr:phosphatase PAP2 family protein [Hyphomicrobiales bacterium]
KADARLGFDWAAWRYWLNAHFVLENALRAIYSYSLPVQLGLLTCLQSFASLEIRMQRLCFAAQLSLLITLVVAALFPTLGPYNYFDIHGAANAPNLFPAATGDHVNDIFNLRSTSPIIPFERMQGIITFPSFHAELGILFVWSVWPVRFMRLIAIAINGLMIAAVPLCGAHYLTDVVAGAVVAGAAILIETAFLSSLVLSRAPEIGSSAKLAASGPASDPPI